MSEKGLKDQITGKVNDYQVLVFSQSLINLL